MSAASADPVGKRPPAGRPGAPSDGRFDAPVVDSWTLGTTLRRLGAHFAASDAVGAGEGGDTDPMEIWGRRIGRALSGLLVVVLVWWLGAQLGWFG